MPGQLVHGEVDVVGVANTVYTVTLYDVDQNARVLGATERLVVNTIEFADVNSTNNCVIFFDKNADGTVNAGEEVVAGALQGGQPLTFNPGLAGPAGANLKIRNGVAAGQLNLIVVGRIVDQSFPQ